MRLKTCSQCCAFAWSPESLGTPPLVALASYSGALSDDFDNNGYLEIRLADVTNTDATELLCKARVQLPDRACHVDWSSHGGGQGIIAVACADGKVYLYPAAAVLQAGEGGAALAPRWTIAEHAGPVRDCHFNPTHPEFLATAGDDGRWHVWSLKPSGPEKVSVVEKSAHSAPLVAVRWHPKHMHILATVSTDGVVNAWNLRQLKLASTLHVSRAAKGGVPTCLAWDPAVATQLVVGIEGGDAAIQKWDLKRAVEPVLVLRGHDGAVSGVDWSSRDPALIASCGGDGQTMWWDANTGERLGTLATESSYMLDVKWCPALPAVLATSSFAPLFCISTAQDATPSGGGGGGGGGGGSVPKWLQKPCGASVNAAMTVVSAVPGSGPGAGEQQLIATHVLARAADPTVESVANFFRELGRTQPGTPERLEWLRAHGYGALSAVAAAHERGDRGALVAYLNQERNKGKGTGEGEGADGDDPFANLTTEAEKPYEERAADLMAEGKVEEALEVCLAAEHFDDAFALAFLRGPESVARVHQAYVAFTAARAAERRHVLYAGAIASGNYGAVADAGEDWRVVLALISTFAGDGYAPACGSLGAALETKGELEGAYVCFLCARDANAIARLLEQQQAPAHKVLQEMQLVEELCGAPATCAFFAECLWEHGRRLLALGRGSDAAVFIGRAAALNCWPAVVMADRLQYLVPGVEAGGRLPPYDLEATPDEPSPACYEFLAAQDRRRQEELLAQQQKQEELFAQQQQLLQQQQRQQQQLRPQQQTPPLQPQPMPFQQPQQFQTMPQRPSPSQPQPQLMPQQQQQQQGLYQPPRPQPTPPQPQLMPQQQQQQQGLYQPPRPQPTPPQPQLMPQQQQQYPAAAQQRPQPPVAQYAPSSGSASAFPPTQPYAAPSTRPQLMPSAQPQPQPQPAALAPPPPPGSRMPSQQQPVMGAVDGSAYAPPPSAPLGGGGVPGSVFPGRAASTPTAHPRLMPHPVSNYSSLRSGASAPRASPGPAAAGAGTGSLALFPVQSLQGPNEQFIMQRLQLVVPQVADPRRRAAAEAAAVELGNHLQRGAVAPQLVQQLVNYMHAVGTPSSRNAWMQLAAQHPGSIEAFSGLGLL